MQACTWKANTGGLEANLHLEPTTPLPKQALSLPKDHTLVQVAYASLNPIDYKMAELPILGNYLLPSRIPGLDFSGTVISTQHSSFQPGDRVHGRLDPPFFGTLASYIVVSKAGISLVPDNVSLRDAATAGIAALTAYQSIAPYVRPGDEVFLNGGSGGTGTFGIQIAKALGCIVTTTCSGPNVELCKRLGADEVINYRDENVVEFLKGKGKKKRFRLVVDNVFENAALYWESRHFLASDGVFVTPGGTRVVQLRDLVLGSVWPGFLGGGRARFVFLRCEADARHLAILDGWMAEGKVKAVVEEEYGMEGAGEAFERLKSGRVRGKLVVRVGGKGEQM